jgi:excisionase family DNA binding protein
MRRANNRRPRTVLPSVRNCCTSRRSCMPQRRWLSVAEAAEYSSLSGDAIRGLLSTGRLTPHRPVPGRVLIDRRQLDALIQSATARPSRRRGVYDRSATGTG